MTYDGKTPWKEWYEAYLKSEEWAARRGAVIARAGGICEGCRAAIATQVHHRPEAYKQLRAVGRELLCDLVALCEVCHGEVAHWEKQTAVEPVQAEPASEPMNPSEALLVALLVFDHSLRAEPEAALVHGPHLEQAIARGIDSLSVEVRAHVAARFQEVVRTMADAKARKKALRDAGLRLQLHRLEEESAAKFEELRRAQEASASDVELQRLLNEHQRLSKRRRLLVAGRANTGEAA